MSSFEERLRQRIDPISVNSQHAEREQRDQFAVAREEKRRTEMALAANRGLVTRVTSKIGELMPSIRSQPPFKGAQWHEHDESNGGRIIVPGSGKPRGEIDILMKPLPSGAVATITATLEGSHAPVYRSREQRFGSDSNDAEIAAEMEQLLIDALGAFASAAATG
jgi:hypothetical protein